LGMLKFQKACRVTGKANIILRIDRSDLAETLKFIETLEGIQDIQTHIALECLWD